MAGGAAAILQPEAESYTLGLGLDNFVKEGRLSARWLCKIIYFLVETSKLKQPNSRTHITISLMSVGSRRFGGLLPLVLRSNGPTQEALPNSQDKSGFLHFISSWLTVIFALESYRSYLCLYLYDACIYYQTLSLARYRYGSSFRSISPSPLIYLSIYLSLSIFPSVIYLSLKHIKQLLQCLVHREFFINNICIMAIITYNSQIFHYFVWHAKGILPDYLLTLSLSCLWDCETFHEALGQSC